MINEGSLIGVITEGAGEKSDFKLVDQETIRHACQEIDNDAFGGCLFSVIFRAVFYEIVEEGRGMVFRFEIFQKTVEQHAEDVTYFGKFAFYPGVEVDICTVEFKEVLQGLEYIFAECEVIFSIAVGDQIRDQGVDDLGVGITQCLHNEGR